MRRIKTSSSTLASCTETLILGFKQSWKRKINVWQWGDSPVVDLSDTAGETAGAVVKVCSLNLEQCLLPAQDVMCQTRTWGLEQEEVSPLRHFAV